MTIKVLPQPRVIPNRELRVGFPVAELLGGGWVGGEELVDPGAGNDNACMAGPRNQDAESTGVDVEARGIHLSAQKVPDDCHVELVALDRVGGVDSNAA